MTRRTLNTVLALFAVAMLAELAWMGQAFAAGAAEEGHDFISQFSIFLLAVFIGYLMSVTNAISSVIVVGALLAVAVEASEAFSFSGHWLAKILGLIALILASVNIFGGFLVTQRMLAMYRRKDR
jgi:NAD(P) transhydrogenase subunit alpha